MQRRHDRRPLLPHSDDVIDLTATQIVAHDEECPAAGSRALDALTSAVGGTEDALRRLQAAARNLDVTAGQLTARGARQRVRLAAGQLRSLLQSKRK